MAECDIENDVLVSVIVPVYNVEKYLTKAITSLINQSYKNIEIILVDDGSTDKSGELCDEFARTDKRITVIHKANGGISSARNEALNRAVGKYIFFFDSDDFVDENLIGDNVKIAEDNQCDIVLFGYISHIVDNDLKVLESKENKLPFAGLYDGDEFTAIRFEHLKKLPEAVWNRLYTREIIGDTRFDESVRFAEDLLFNIEILKKQADKIYYNSKCYYNYMIHTQSLTNIFSERKFDDMLYAIEKKEDLVSSWGKNDTYQEQLDIDYTNTIYRAFENFAFPECSYSFFESVSKLKKYCRNKKIQNAIRRMSIKNINENTMLIVLCLIKCRMYVLTFFLVRMRVKLLRKSYAPRNSRSKCKR